MLGDMVQEVREGICAGGEMRGEGLPSSPLPPPLSPPLVGRGEAAMEMGIS